jgi:hypothetical protein
MSGMNLSLLKQPSALVPIALAAAALTIPYILVLIFGPDPAGDEGVGAHSWQLLMLLQIPAMLFFLARWAPQQPKQALVVLVLQVAAFLAAASPVFLLGL